MAEKPPEPDPNSSDLDNSPDSEDFGHLGERFQDVWIADSAGYRFVASKSVAVRARGRGCHQAGQNFNWCKCQTA